VLVVATLVGCTTAGSGAPDDWSRTYLRTLDRVWRATLSTLDNEGYVVEAQDLERGRITAVPGQHRVRSALLVSVEEVAEGVRVDVQVRPGVGGGPPAPEEMEHAARAFLLGLDQELRVTVGGAS
jgi:hypothetical protein